MENEDFSIQELCDQTGLPRRTIHFYTQQGLLPPPQGAGLGARYGRPHLTRLRLIPFLRKQGMRLDQIREKFLNSKPDDLERMQAQIELPAEAERSEPMRLNASVRSESGRQDYHHYSFSGGITLIVPANLSGRDKQKLQALLKAARQIYGQIPDDSSLTPNTMDQIY